MFEDFSVSAANMVLILFWIIIISIAAWGFWWLHSTKSK
jgi:hypothetical protein